MLIVELPKRFTRDTMYQVLDKVIDEEMQPKDYDIGINFKTLDEFVEPAGVTILSNLFEWLFFNGVSITTFRPDNPPIYSEDPLKFLDDSMFFYKYIGKYISTNPKLRKTTIPLELVSYSQSYQWLDQKFIPWLSLQLGVPAHSLSTIKMCFGEIFNNINDHSKTEIKTGCIFAQSYHRKNTIKIVVSDFGVGIPDNIRKIYPGLTDNKALEYAIKEGVTSKTTPRNLGVGLHTLFKNVVETNGGSIFIHSNYGILNCVNGYNGPKVFSELKQSYYPGTLIEVNIRTDNISCFIDEIEEEFGWD
ncbi:ATP-binding protein [Metabacillus litoralis]|uniref:ATP-binding protein n=1 Tax=Metabacillus litoralis TaxID=152268 RepID=UPI0020407CDE|nr:ATP-binding protein [Metabacillus litoralis]MCM3411214.1 ATP-binding protein [Metabacillus litoralis]